MSEKLEQAIKKAKQNMDKIKDVDAFIDEVKGCENKECYNSK